jgi:drug/metabolite transporter (DMT)-like permease
VTLPLSPAARGYAQILAAATLWGSSVVAARALVHDLPPTVLTHLTVLISAVALGCVLGLWQPGLLRVKPAELGRIALIGGVGFAGAATLLNFAILKTNAATAIVLNYLAPALILGWNAARGSERLTARKALAALVCVAGCALTVGLAQGRLLFHPAGVAAGTGAAVAFSFFTIYSKPIVQRNSSLTFTFYAFVTATAFYFVFQRPSALAAGFETMQRAAAVVCYVVFLCVVPPILFFRGLRSVPESGAAIACSFEIVVTAVLGWMLLREGMLGSQVVGALMVIASVVLIEGGSGIPAPAGPTLQVPDPGPSPAANGD